METLLFFIVLAFFLIKEKVQIYRADQYAKRMAEIRESLI